MAHKAWLYEPAQDAYERDRQRLFEVQLAGQQAILDPDPTAGFRAAEQIDEITRPPQEVPPELDVQTIVNNYREPPPAPPIYDVGQEAPPWKTSALTPEEYYRLPPSGPDLLPPEQQELGTATPGVAGAIPMYVRKALKQAGAPEWLATDVGTALPWAIPPLGAASQGLQTDKGSIAGTAGVFGAGAVGGLGGMIRNALAATGATVAAERTNTVTKDLPEPLATGLPLVAGLAGALGGYKSPEIAKGAIGPHGVLPETLAAAQGRRGLEPALGLGIEDVGTPPPPGLPQPHTLPPVGANVIDQLGHPEDLKATLARIPAGTSPIEHLPGALQGPAKTILDRIDPSIELRSTEPGRLVLGRAIMGANAQTKVEEALLVTIDRHAQRPAGLPVGRTVPGEEAILRLDKDGMVPRPNGTRIPYQDFMEHPVKFGATPEELAYVQDAWSMIDWADEARIAAGGKPYPAVPGREHFWPREVEERQGIEATRTRHDQPRYYEDAATGQEHGIEYGKNGPREDARQYALGVYQGIRDAQFSDAVAARAASYSQLVPPAIRDKLMNAAEALKTTRQEIGAERARVMASSRLASKNVWEARLRMVQAETKVKQVEAESAGIDRLRSALDKIEARGESAFEKAAYKENYGQPGYPFGPQTEESILVAALARAEGKAYFTSGEEIRQAMQRNGQRLGQRWATTLEDAKAARLEYEGLRSASKGFMNRISRREGPAISDRLYREEVQARRTAASAKAEYSAAVKRARQDNVTRAPIFGNQPGNAMEVAHWHNRVLRPEDVEIYRKYVDDNGVRPGVGTLNRVLSETGGLIRSTSAVGDFATGAIQGLPVMGISPRIWAKMQLEQYRAFGSPARRSQFFSDHVEALNQMGGRVILEGEEATGGFHLVGQAAEKIHGTAGTLIKQPVRETIGRFEAAYQHSLNAARVYIWEAMHGKYGIAGEDALAEFINKATGGLQTSRMGVLPSQRSFESFWLAFSPRLLRSTVSLAKDAMAVPVKWAAIKAGANLTIGLEEKLAVQSMAKLGAGMTAGYVAASLAAGKSEEEILHGLDPTAGKQFLSIRIGDEWYGIGGQFRALTQLMANMGADLGRIAHGEPPAAISSLDPNENPLVGFYSSRGAPALNLGGGAIEGLSGGKWNAVPYRDINSVSDYISLLGSSALPFAVQGMMEGQSAWGIAAGFLGARASDATPNERLATIADKRMEAYGRDNPQETEYYKGGNFWEALPKIQAEIKEDYPDLWQQSVQHASSQRKEAEMYRAGVAERLKGNDDALQSGKIGKEDWKKAEEKARHDATAVIQHIYRDQDGKFRSGNPVLDDYYQAVEDSKRGDPRADPDWDAVDAYLSRQTPTAQKVIRENTGLARKGTPLQQAKAAADDLKYGPGGYYTLPKYQGFSADEARQIDATYAQMMIEANRKLPAGEVPDADLKYAALRKLPQYETLDKRIRNGLLRKIDGDLGTLSARETWKSRHPEAFVFDGAGPLTPSDRALIARLLGQK